MRRHRYRRTQYSTVTITKSRSTVVIASIWLAASTLSSVQLIVGRSSVRTLLARQQVGL